MLIYTIFILLLAPSQGSFRSARHNVNLEDRFEDALLEHLYDISEGDSDFDLGVQNDADDDLLEILQEIRKDVEHKKKKRKVSVREYENYDYDNENSYKKSLKTTFYELTHQKYYKRDKVKDSAKHEYKKLIGKSKNKNRKDTSLTGKIEELSKKETAVVANDKSVAEYPSVNEKKEIVNSKDLSKLVRNNDINAAVVNDEIESKDKKDTETYPSETAKKEDNVQVATVNVDDTVEKQQEIIDNINPRDIFLEADTNSSMNTSTPSVAHRVAPSSKVVTDKDNKEGLDKTSFIAVIAGCVVAGITGIALATYCWYKLRNETKELNDESSKKRKQSPITIKKEATEDEKLAQSAEMFHYLHAKKQMQQMEEPTGHTDANGHETSDDEDDEDTVYECPGLAPPGDMKVVNPLFSDTESHHSDKHSDSLSIGDDNEEAVKKSISSTSSNGEPKP